ncbi:MAG: PKD domain-containing protein [Candidatus Thermoplasmatota archaeon]|nr:PKD domain-containing protein [Candidatus Thermoplasmatota archaeon]
MKKHIGVISLVVMLVLTSFMIISVSADELITEGFEEGIMPPSGGWYTVEENLNQTWGIVDGNVYPEYVHSGEYAAWINYDSSFYSDNWLISPDYTLSEYEEATLSFWAASDTNFPTATVELYIRGDGFSDMIWNMTENETWPDFEYRQKSFNLSSYCGNTINISWRYVGLNGESFGLDDINLELITPSQHTTTITIENESPANNSVDISISQPNVSVDISAVYEYFNGYMGAATLLNFNWTIEGKYIENTGVNDDEAGTKTANILTPLNYSTEVIWYVNVTVNEFEEKKIFRFTTEGQPNQLPEANFTYIVEGVKVTFNGSISYDEDGTITNYTWDFGDGNVSYIANPVHFFGANGSYDVNLTVQDNEGANNSYNDTITVANARPVAEFTAESDGKKVTFTSTSSDVDGTIANYTWDFGDGNTSYDENPVHTYAQENKQYTVTLMVTDNLGLTNSTTQIIKTQDTTDPAVEIVTPQRALYINGEKKFGRFLGMAIIIGDITIEVNASDEGSGIAKVEFYGGLLGTKLLGNDTEAPYAFEWTRDRIRFFHIQILKVVAYDTEGNTAMDRMIVRKLL